MRFAAVALIALLAGCATPETTRVEGFAAPDAKSFIYTARTDTVMTENDDGTAERLRRLWLADALTAHGMCGNGYVVDIRHFVAQPVDGPFANGGDIVYRGRCL